MTKFIVLDYFSLMSSKKITCEQQEKYDKLWEDLAKTAKEFKKENNVYTRIRNIQ